jgi:serine/threonine-protein kinase
MINIPGFTISNKIAEGGCAQIFCGVDQSTGHPVAIKILQPRNLSNKAESKRLIDEGNLGLKLQHVNIVRTFAAGVAGNLPYVVLEYIKGHMLREMVVKKQLLGNVETISLARGLTNGIRYLHNQGIYHRDIKPDNIMICEDGTIKLLDLGFAENTKAFSFFGRKLEGSPAYMAPELLTTKKASFATDLYALGCTLYEAATGFTPFGGMSDNETISNQTNLRATPRPIQSVNPRVSTITEKMIARALMKDPAHRYKSADEMMMDIARNPANSDPKSSNRLHAVTA